MNNGCDQCRFVQVTEIQSDLTRKYFCRRFPPHPIAISNGRNVNVVNVYPAVSTENTCGEFRLPVLSAVDLQASK